tara:strand:- start:500 stop:847 length:348 start_codon:yes stop_codon:yes gene_type:complete
MKNASNILKAIIIASLLLILLIFSFQNLDAVSVDFFNLKSKEIPFFIILIGVLAVGILIGYLIGLISGSKISKRKLDKLNIKANERIAEAEEKSVKLTQEIKIAATSKLPTTETK